MDRRDLTQVRALRELTPRRLGWLLVVAGAVAIFLCWWGVSGQSITAKQLPYFASAGLIAVGLFIVAGALLAKGADEQRTAALERKLDTLYGLLVEEAGTTDSRTVVLPSGTSYHRADCPLVVGKPQAQPIEPRVAVEEGRSPCQVCEPPR
jgi:hypothetical protein